MQNAESLDTILKFTSDDLVVNRQGHLSDYQQKHLLRRALQLDGRWRNPLIIGAVISLIALLLLPKTAPAFVGVGIITVGFLLIALQGYLEIRKRVQSDLYDGQVKAITGILRVEELNHHKTLHVQDLYFKVSNKTQHAFHDRTVYTLYYAPQSGVLVAADLVGEDGTEAES